MKVEKVLREHSNGFYLISANGRCVHFLRVACLDEWIFTKRETCFHINEPACVREKSAVVANTALHAEECADALLHT